MLYRVSGTNKDTNAPMALEIEAPSKAAAELKASAQGMNVADVQDVTPASMRPTSSHRGEGPDPGTTPDSGGMRNLLIIGSILIVLALTAYLLLPRVLERNIVAEPAPDAAVAGEEADTTPGDATADDQDITN